MSSIQRKVEKPWFYELAAILLDEPGLTNKELGDRLNRQPVTISIVRNTDMFKDLFATMQKEYFDEFKRQSVAVKLEDKIAGLADVAVEELTKRVIEEGPLFPTDSLLATTKTALTSLGFGANGSGNTGNRSGDVHVHVGDVNVLAEARERMQNARAISKQKVIEGTVADGGETEKEQPLLQASA